MKSSLLIPPAVRADGAFSRPPEASLTWTDPVTGHQGFLVIDRLVRGLSSGGLRMRQGCTYEEVRDLAAGMSVKEALHYDPSNRYLPMGGAKGGIDCDPHSDEARGVLSRFLAFIRPYVDQHWATGDDLGTTTELIEEVLGELGVEGCIAPVVRTLDDPAAARKRFAEAFAVDVDGIALAELVGGCGVAEAVLTVLDRDGVPRPSATAAVQGFGAMGGATARFLAAAGIRVVAISDVHGTVANPRGLAVEDMLHHRGAFGSIDRGRLGPDDILLDRDDCLSFPTDVLVPAATSYTIHEANQARVAARYVVEAANVPVTAAAEQELRRRGCVVIPDVVANSGTNAWWWWTLFGDVAPGAAASLAKVRGSLRALVTETLEFAGEAVCTPREAARHIADARRELLLHRLGER
ncbi:Glu/Leu/Phe/Val dehydrogenase dimerization domain-containing protein [Streptomyces sp. NPDC002574]|uniref:Glu/Leu/Phe/Val dehydrogenase dimerization domain-containing protein n=1 Tax=Streptomyces sp. NPDC002574 TaxID=3364652 RepID=UPI0036BA3A2A